MSGFGIHRLLYRLLPSRASLDYCKHCIATGDVAAAMPALRAKSAAGHAEAAYLLGQLYAEGKLIPKNTTEALRLYLRAAEKGSPEAADQLGSWYLFGAAQADDPMQAAGLQTAANLDKANPLAALFDQQGVHQDYQQAAYWNQQAVKQGMVPAKSRLGLQYALGLGVKKSLEHAIALLKPAAEAGDELALVASGIYYLGGFGGTADPLAARQWLDAAPPSPSGLANVLWALTYISGDPTQWQPQQAFDLLLPAAKQGNAAAMYYIGDLIAAGHISPPNMTAELWMRRAAAKGHVRAIAALVRMLTSSTASNASPLEAASLCRQAADNGDGEAMFLLAHLYLQGTGLQKSDIFAFKWAQKSSQAQFSAGTELLAWMHAKGVGTPADAASALKLLDSIAEKLSPDGLRLKQQLLSPPQP